MKLLKNIGLMLLASVALFACEREYDAPPLNEPIYNGPAANMTIAELRTQCAAATKDAPVNITEDWVLKAVVSANDESGNIYKKIYLQDETSAIEMQVDQGSVYNYYPVGQVVYVSLKGLCVSVYGDEQQLGHPDGYLYRTPWVDFQAVVSKDRWADANNIQPIDVEDISLINGAVDQYKFKLVRLKNVAFKNGGKNTFAPSDGYGEEYITDKQGNTLMVRTSNYANFAGDKLPEGRGDVVGILGRFNGSWQLTVRTRDDVMNFTGSSEGGDEGGESGETVIFSETFGEPQKSGNYWPYVKDYTGFDNPASMFKDESGQAFVRMQDGLSNIWFPANKDITLQISGINAGEVQKATLEFQVGANLYNKGESIDLAVMKVKCNGNAITIPSKVVSNDKGESNKPFKFTFNDVAVSANTVLEFTTEAATNDKGLRLYSVKLYTGGSSAGEGDGGTVIEPPLVNN